MIDVWLVSLSAQPTEVPARWTNQAKFSSFQRPHSRPSRASKSLWCWPGMETRRLQPERPGDGCM